MADSCKIQLPVTTIGSTAAGRLSFAAGRHIIAIFQSSALQLGGPTGMRKLTRATILPLFKTLSIHNLRIFATVRRPQQAAAIFVPSNSNWDT